MVNMLSRRHFGKLVAASMAAQTFSSTSHLIAQQPSLSADQLSIMIWTLKKLGSFSENLDRVAQAGYLHIELVEEFKSWTPEETTRYIDQMGRLNITIDAICGMKLGFADLTDPAAYVTELKALIPTAKKFNSPTIILISGKTVPTAPVGAQHEAAVKCLRACAPILADAGITGLLEPIDRLENPTIYLDNVTEAFSIANAVNSPAIKVLYDLYHEQRTYGNLIEKLEANIHQVGLVHVADVPGRHEPGTGEIDYPVIYRKLAQLNYKGKIAMEFYPTGDIVPTLRAAKGEFLRTRN